MNETDFTGKRLRELALRAGHSAQPCFTRFLDPAVEPQARAIAAQCAVELSLFGGYAGAERRMAAFYSSTPPQDASYPLAELLLRWNEKFSSLTHRDLLGAVMGLGLERDAIGDITFAQEKGCAVLFVHDDVKAYVLANFSSAGRTALRASIAEHEIKLAEPEGYIARITVGSARLDAILAASLKLPRSAAQRLIEGGFVKCNHVETQRCDQRPESGALISVRGHGRMRIVSFEGNTRKGREAIRLFIYT